MTEIKTLGLLLICMGPFLIGHNSINIVETTSGVMILGIGWFLFLK